MRLASFVLCLPWLGCASPQPAGGTGLPVRVRSGLDAADASWHGAEPIADGVRGGAARFDGQQAHVDLGPCPIGSTEAFTLRCRLRTTSAAFCTPLMARDGDAVGISLVLGRTPGVLSFEAWTWRSVRIATATRVDDGRWHDIEVAFEPEAGLAMLFLDGVAQGQADLGAGGSPNAQLRLGDNIGVHQPFAGDLDEVEVLVGTTHRDELLAAAPVLPRSRRDAELRSLRSRLLPKTTPSLAESAAADWPARRAAVRAHVTDALGLSPTPVRAPLDVQVHAETVRDGVRLQRVSWIGFPGQRATGWLWLPETAPTERRPAMLCPHGHWENGAMHPVVQARCAAFAQFGWVCLAVDSVHVEHVASGVNAIGAMTWHNQRAIDLLLARDDVDPARIGVTGASGGGQQTYYLMALEDRLAAAAPMVMACYFAEIVSDTSAHCGCNHLPRLAAGTDVPEMCAVFAPRPVMFGSVARDWTHMFPQEGLPELTAHWLRQHGPAPRSRFADEEHNYDRPMREEVYAFFHDVWLGPASDGAKRTRVAEPPFHVFSLAEMQALARNCPPVHLDPAAMAKEYLARRPRVERLADLAPGLDLTVNATSWRGDNDGNGWLRCLVDSDVPLPFLLLSHDRDRRSIASQSPTVPYLVVVDPLGMAHARREHDWLPGTVLVDPRPYGEWAPYRAAWQRNGILLGRGEGYQAALDVARVCASLPGEGPVHLVGRGEAGVVAVLAAHLCPRIVRVQADELGPNYADDGNRLPLCPELLRFSDLPDLIRTLPPGCWQAPPATGPATSAVGEAPPLQPAR